jgi:hypothetical protein
MKLFENKICEKKPSKKKITKGNSKTQVVEKVKYNSEKEQK